MGFFGGTATSTGSGSFTPRQSKQVDSLLNSAQQLFEGEGFFSADPFGGINPIAGRTPEQQQLLQNQLQQLTGISGQGFDALSTGLGPFDPNASGINDVIGLVGRDIQENLSENVLPSIGRAATAAGQFGGSRQGVAEGIAGEAATEAFADAATRLRFDDFNRFQSQQQNLLSNLAGITQGLTQPAFQASEIERQDRQDEIDVELERFARESGLDLANLQAFKELISGNFGGTQRSSSSTPTSGAAPLLGSLAASFVGYDRGSELIADGLSKLDFF